MPTFQTRKNIQRFVTLASVLAIFFNTLPATLAATTFSDVSATNRNATAIQFLASQGIITGYPDGTFQPDKAVSRVEFLKLALKSSNVALDVSTPTGFSDVDESAWYAPYLRKAKKEGWVQGYSDNTFKPNQSVNKVEGLKILAQVQGWQLPTTFDQPFNDAPSTAWFTPYVVYAKVHNYLEETGNFFIPSAALSRAKTSEYMYRSLITKEANATVFSTDLINTVNGQSSNTQSTTPPSATQTPSTTTTTTAPVNFTPVAYQTIPKSFFDNINLDNDFPNTFYVNELYDFSGKMMGGTFSDAFAFLRTTSDETFENTAPNISTTGTFNIPVMFRNPGNYQLGIIEGNTGSSKVVNISVLPNLPTPAFSGVSTTPTSLLAKYANQKTTFSWNNGTDNLAKLTFTEGSVTKTFFTRQNFKKFDVIYNDFKDFQPGQMTYTVSSAEAAQTGPLTIDTPWATSAPQTITAITHTYSETHPDFMSYTSLPETFNGPTTITVTGKALSDLLQSAAIIRPDGKVDTVTMSTSGTTSTYLDENTIPSGNNYNFAYNATANGTYIVEINGKDGLATLNTPVYIGPGLPLIPDFFDLENSDATTDAATSSNILTNQLLQLINQDRNKGGLNSVNADSSLNQLAQNYANEMVARNFFGHVDPDGLTPDQRRINAGIPTAVGENLARAPNLLYAHYGLMRSGIHRSNILDPDWTRIGLGVSKTADNYLMVVEEFSTDPVTPTTLANTKNGMYNTINQKRQAAGIPTFSTDSTLESVADNWSTSMVQQNFFDFNAPDGSTLPGNVQKSISNKSVQMYILESESASQLTDQIFSSTQVLSGTWKSIGIGLEIDKTGMFKLTLLLAN